MSEEGIKTAAKKLQGSLTSKVESSNVPNIEDEARELVAEIKNTTRSPVEQLKVATQLREVVYGYLTKAQQGASHMTKTAAAEKQRQATFCCKTVDAAIKILNDMRENPLTA